MEDKSRNDIYRSAKNLAIFPVLSLGAMLVVSGLLALFSFISLLLPDLAISLDEGGSVSVGLMMVGLLALVELPIRIICVVSFLIWLYRVYNNLSALGAKHLESSPGWAVGWWFIPFANLVKPFQVVRELYNESDSDIENDTFHLKTSPGTPAEIGFWWGAFLLSGFLYRFSDALYGKGDLPESSYFEPVFLAGALLATIAAGLAIYIVVTVVRRQDARYEVLTRDLLVPQPANLPAA